MCIHTYTYIFTHACLHVCEHQCVYVCLFECTHTHTHACTLCICMHAYKHLRIAMFRLDHTIPFNQSVADIFHLGNTLKNHQHTNTSHLHIQSQELYTIRCVCVCVCVYKYVSTLGHTKVCTYVVQYTYDTKSRQPYTHAHIRIHIHS